MDQRADGVHILLHLYPYGKPEDKPEEREKQVPMEVVFFEKHGTKIVKYITKTFEDEYRIAFKGFCVKGCIRI